MKRASDLFFSWLLLTVLLLFGRLTESASGSSSKAEESGSIAPDSTSSASSSKKSSGGKTYDVASTPVPGASSDFGASSGSGDKVAAPNPQWDYCAGTQTATTKQLYVEPPCGPQSIQKPIYNTSTVFYQATPVSGLDFCCKINYTALLPVFTNPRKVDREAEDLYKDAKLRMIDRYDCKEFYPYHTCEPCLYAYRTWLCSMMFPLKCTASGGDNTGTLAATRVCDFVCYEVMRKCPAEFGFDCPSVDEGTYGKWIGIFGDLGVASAVGGGGCNRVHYNDDISWSGAWSPRHSGSAAGILVLAALVFLF